jgi:AraC-like DNA-binding protein/mannose-6-phosphate isomerase-like protein (cupin superfamily)
MEAMGMNLEKYYIRFNETITQMMNDEELTKEKYDYFNNSNLDEDLFIQFKGYDITIVPHPPQYQVGEHRHNFFEFIYIYRGSCTTTIDSSPLKLNEGDLCLMNLKASHTIQSDNPLEDIIFNILVKQSMLDNAYFKLISYNEFISDFFLDSLQNKRKTDNYILFRRETPNSPYEDLAQHIIYEFYEGALYKEKMFDFLFISLLIELARNYGRHINKEISQKLKNVDISEIIEYIVDHCDTVSITSLAEHFSYNPNYFSILIKKYIGSSFSDILHNIRFKKAAQMLTETSLSVVEIMESVGYTNRTWFTQKFEDRYKLSPSEYRRNH